MYKVYTLDQSSQEQSPSNGNYMLRKLWKQELGEKTPLEVENLRLARKAETKLRKQKGMQRVALAERRVEAAGGWTQEEVTA